MEFVSFNLAKRLKEKGFRKAVNAYYDNKQRLFDVHPALDMNDAGYRYSAPTIAQVLEWLREEEGLHIAIYIVNDGFVSSAISFQWDESYCEHDIEHYNHKGYSTYEEAALAEIEYVLDNLI